LARSPKSTTVLVATVKPLGAVLVTPKHFVLYEFTDDRKNFSVCTGACASTWPPYLLDGGRHSLHGPKGVHGLGTIPRRHRLQLTINGHPLYLFVGDHTAGQANGEGFQRVWYVVGPSGHKVMPPTSQSATKPSAPSLSAAPATPQPTTGGPNGAAPPATGGTKGGTPTTASHGTPPPSTNAPTTAAPPPTTQPPPPTTAPPPPTTQPPPPTTQPPPPTTTTTCSIPQGNGGDGDGDNNGGPSDGDGCQ
jgi:predicted lipoprotein with Yx(FWY)xxD motif